MNYFGSKCLALLAATGVGLVACDNDSDHINAESLTQGMTLAARAQIAATLYWHENGELPCSADGMGRLDLSLQRGGDPVLKDLAVTGCGEITATYTTASGMVDGTVVFTASLPRRGPELNWDCATGDFRRIKQYASECRYDASLASGAVPALAPQIVAATPVAAQPDLEPPAADCRDGVALYRSVFTDAIKERVPQSRLVALGPDTTEVVFFSEIIGAAGQQIRHRWFHDDTEIAEVPLAVGADRWPAWSTQRVGSLRPGVLRVEVMQGGCLVGQESVQIAAQQQLDPASRSGWMRPRQALETALARQNEQSKSVRKPRSYVDGRTADGDTLLTAAIRRQDEQEALILINSADVSSAGLGWEEQEKYRLMANPLLRDRDGITPIDLAQRLNQPEVVEALVASAISPRKKQRRSSRGPDGGQWDDSTLYSLSAGDAGAQRFADGDTALIRATRLGNERAVLTLLRLGRSGPAIRPERISEQLYAYDAGGRQPIDIARSEGFHGVERLLELGMRKYTPRWALSRATFAANMNGDEPGECRKVGFSDESELHFFAELTDIAGRQVTHEWRIDRKTVHKVKFDVKSQRAKTHSSRRFSPIEDIGLWEVRVVEGEDNVLGTRRLHYQTLTERIDKNRDKYIGSEGCNLGGSAMYTLADAHAPISKLQYFVDQGAALKPRSNRYQDLYSKVISNGSIALTRWFLDRGADPNGSVNNGNTPLTLAVEAGDAPMVLFLLAKGADVNKPRFRGRLTPLHVASVELDVNIGGILLASGADPNAADSGGATALHRATNRCSAEFSLALLQRGADPKAVSRRGRTPIEWAATCFKNNTWPRTAPGLQPLLAEGIDNTEAAIADIDLN